MSARLRGAWEWASCVQRAGRRLACAALCVGAIAPALAGVTPETSRIVFAADAAEQSVQLYNLNTYPVLVQAWVDDGDIRSVPQSSNAPIVALPPIFRMAPHDQTSLRLLNAGDPLPTDRESLLWLNLYEIPATPKDWGRNGQTMTVTMRTQIKLFVRPAGLADPGASRLRKLVLSLAPTQRGLALTIDNPTPYYATIGTVQVSLGDAAKQAVPDMIAPFSRTTVAFDAWHASPDAAARVTFSLIGDDGNPEADTRTVRVGACPVDVACDSGPAPDAGRVDTSASGSTVAESSTERVDETHPRE
ncbi:molecular chaperone [Burkholderia pseudomultivorans]|uniref:fimbrial biogenesis chaperone n=1 Tax=Burkholderia pseudomultivorans TaxID=1207504 RepID=UPI000AC188B7|nr:molecular chaperone [Burkholderia pseudomultivorans]